MKANCNKVSPITMLMLNTSRSGLGHGQGFDGESGLDLSGGVGLLNGFVGGSLPNAYLTGTLHRRPIYRRLFAKGLFFDGSLSKAYFSATICKKRVERQGDSDGSPSDVRASDCRMRGIASAKMGTRK